MFFSKQMDVVLEKDDFLIKHWYNIGFTNVNEILKSVLMTVKTSIVIVNAAWTRVNDVH